MSATRLGPVLQIDVASTGVLNLAMKQRFAAGLACAVVSLETDSVDADYYLSEKSSLFGVIICLQGTIQDNLAL